jgi:hypothetical protein
MFTLLTYTAATLLVPALMTPPQGAGCQLDRPTYVSADDRAIARFTAATHDYVAYGTHGPIFNADAAAIFRFRLRISRWLHRYDATLTLADAPPIGRHGHRALAAHGPAAALPELPDELEYRLAGPHLLLVDRHTNAVVDLLPHAFEEGWGR